MSAYRMHFQLAGHIYGRENFEADDDVAAIRVAGVLYNACADVCDGFELWQGTRQIRVRQAPDERAGLADLVQNHQRIVMEVEERIAQSGWMIARSHRRIKTLRHSDWVRKYD
jgi:hypothetical protein